MSRANRSGNAATKCFNRIAAIMHHCSWYSGYGTSRLARDAGVAKSTICHLMYGQTNPLYSTLERVVQCLSRRLNRELPYAEVISPNGEYPTCHICQLVGCRGCLPAKAYLPDGSLRDEWKDIKPGQWTGDLNEAHELHIKHLAKGGS